MSNPNSRSTFKDFCLRKLGHPVIKINLDDAQIDDRIDEALNFYYDYHFDGVEKIYLKHQLTANDVTNQYITVSDLVVGINKILPFPNDASNTLFNVQYYMTMDALMNVNSGGLGNFESTMQYMQTLNFYFGTNPGIRFNRHTNRVYLDLNWETQLTEGHYLVFEAYRYLNPDDYTDIWKDRWLQRYATALIKLNWGEALSKFNLPMIAGVTFNGLAIKTEAQAEIDKLEEEMIHHISLPASPIIG